MGFAIIFSLSSFRFIFRVQRIGDARVESSALLKALLDRAYDLFQGTGIRIFIGGSNQARAFSIKVSWFQGWWQLRLLAIWSVKSAIAWVDSWGRLIRIIEWSFGTLPIQTAISLDILPTLPILLNNLFLFTCTHLLCVRCERQWFEAFQVMIRSEISAGNMCNFIESPLLYLLLINNCVGYHAVRAGKFPCSCLLPLFLRDNGGRASQIPSGVVIIDSSTDFDSRARVNFVSGAIQSRTQLDIRPESIIQSNRGFLALGREGSEITHK